MNSGKIRPQQAQGRRVRAARTVRSSVGSPLSDDFDTCGRFRSAPPFTIAGFGVSTAVGASEGARPSIKRRLRESAAMTLHSPQCTHRVRMFNAHWSESGDARGVVTYSNADTKDVVVVKYNEWARVIDEDGDAFWWNVVTQESAWERPGWNQGSENGVKYYFNNITKWASLEMPYGYPPEYTVEELKALSLPAVSKVATPGPTHDPTSPVIDVKDGAASTPMLTPAPAVGIGGHVLSVPTPAPSTMSKEEKAAQDVMMRKYKKQFLSRACLSRIPLLANLAPHDEVLITSLFRLQVCPAGALLCEAGEAVKNMYVVCQGVVALSAVDPVSAQESCVAHVHVRPLSSSRTLSCILSFHALALPPHLGPCACALRSLVGL